MIRLKMLSTMFLQIIFDIYEEDLALNNQQGFIFHQTQPNQIIYI